jgi:hypothetical protein
MKVRAFLLAASVTVNLWLGWCIIGRSNPESRPATLGKAVAAKPMRTPGIPGASKTSPGRADAVRFSWHMIENLDPREYSARLRAIGCPEHVVRTLLLDVLCSSREEKLARVQPVPHWAGPSETRAAKLRIFQERQAIRKEFDALGKEILGVDCVESMRFHELVLVDALFSFLIGPLPEDRLEHYVFALRRYENISSDLDQLPPLAAWREAQKLSNPRPGLPEGLLTPQQQREFSARAIAFFLIMRRDSAEAEVFLWSPAELRRASEAAAHTAPAAISLDDAMDDLDVDALRQVVAATLSPERALQWEQSMDRDYTDAVSCLREATLPLATADVIHRIKQETEATWLQALYNEDLQETDRAAAADRVRIAAAENVRQMLGPAFEDYKKGNRPWMKLQEGAQ